MASRKSGVPMNTAVPPTAQAAANVAASAVPAQDAPMKSADLMGMLLDSAQELGVSPSDLPRLIQGDPDMLREMGARLFQMNPEFREQVQKMHAQAQSTEAASAAAAVPAASTPRAQAPKGASAASAAPAEASDIKTATSAVFSRLSAAVKRYLGPDFSMNIQIHEDRIAMQVVQTVRKGRQSVQHPITSPTAASPATSGAVAVSLISGVNKLLREMEADHRAFEAAEDEDEYEEDEEDDMDEDEVEEDEDYEDEDEDGYEE